MTGTEYPASGSVLDRAWRAAFWLGFRAARQWWWLRRPSKLGVLAAIWHDGRVLMVRQSYRPVYTWPGGGVRRGETAQAALLRELREELGLVLEPAALHPLGLVTVEWDFCQDRVELFEIVLREKPVLVLDNREIIAAEYLAPAAALARPSVPHFRAYLEARTDSPPR